MKMDNFGGNTQMIEWLRSKDSWRPFLTRISNQLKEIVDTPEAHRRGMMQLSHKTVVNVEKCRIPSKKSRPLKKRRRLRIVTDSESDAEGIIILSDDEVLPKTETLIVTLIDSDSERDLPMKNGKKLLRKRHFSELFGSDSEDETTSSVLQQKFEHHSGKVVIETHLASDGSDASHESDETIIGDKCELIDAVGKNDSYANASNGQTQSTIKEPVLKIKVTATFPEVSFEIEKSPVISPSAEPDSSTLPRDGSNVESLATVLEISENKVGKPFDKNDIVSSSGLPASPLDNSSVTSRTGQIRVKDCRSLGISDNWCFGVNTGESSSNSPPVISASAKPVSSKNPSDASISFYSPSQRKEMCIGYAQKMLLSLPEKCKALLYDFIIQLEFFVSDTVSFRKEEENLQKRSQECEEQRKNAFTSRIYTQYTYLKNQEHATKLQLLNLLPQIENFCNIRKKLIFFLSGIVLKKLSEKPEDDVFRLVNLEDVANIVSALYDEQPLAQGIESAVNDTCQLTTSDTREEAGNLSWHTISDSLPAQSLPAFDDSSTTSSQSNNSTVVPSRQNVNVPLQQIIKDPQPTAESNNTQKLISGCYTQKQTLPKQCPIGIPLSAVKTALHIPQSHVMGPPVYPAKQGINPCGQLVQSHSATSVENYPLYPNNSHKIDNSVTENAQRCVNVVMNTQQSTESANGRCEKRKISDMQLASSNALSRLHRKPLLHSLKQQLHRSTGGNSQFVSAKVPQLVSLSHHIQEPNQNVTGHSGAGVGPPYLQQNQPLQTSNQQLNIFETQSHRTPYINKQKGATYPSHPLQSQQGSYKRNELERNQYSQIQQFMYQQSAVQQVSCQQAQDSYQSTQLHKMYPERTNSQNFLSQSTSRIPPQKPESHLTSFMQSQDAQFKRRKYSQSQVPHQQTQLLNQKTQNHLPYRANQHEHISNQQMQPQQSKFFYHGKSQCRPEMPPTQSHQNVYQTTPSQIVIRSLNQSLLPKQQTHIQASSANVSLASVQPIIATVNHSRVAAVPASSSMDLIPDAKGPSAQTHGVQFALARSSPARPLIAPDHSVRAVQTSLSNVWHAAKDPAATQSPNESFRVQASAEMNRTQASIEFHRAQDPAEACQIHVPAEVNRAQVPTQSHLAQALAVSYRPQVLVEVRQAQALLEAHRVQALSDTLPAQTAREAYESPSAAANRAHSATEINRDQVAAPTEAYRAQTLPQSHRGLAPAQSNRAIMESLRARALSLRAESQRTQALGESNRAQASCESHRTQVPAEAYLAQAPVELYRPQTLFESHRAQTLFESHRAQALAESQRAHALARSQQDYTLVESNRVQALSESIRTQGLAESIRTQGLAESIRTQGLAESIRTQGLAESNRAQALAESNRTQALAESNRTQTLAESNRAQTLAESNRAQALAGSHRAQHVAESHRAQVLVESQLVQAVAKSEQTQVLTEAHRAQALSESHRAQDRAEYHRPESQFHKIQSPRVPSRSHSTVSHQNHCSTIQSRPSQSPTLQSPPSKTNVDQFDATQCLPDKTSCAEGHPEQTHRAQGLPDQIYNNQSPQCIRAQPSLSVRTSSLSLQTQVPSSPCVGAQIPPVEFSRIGTDPAMVLPTRTIPAQVVPPVTQHEQSHLGRNETLLKKSVQSNREQLDQPLSSLLTLLRVPNQNKDKTDCELEHEHSNVISNCSEKQSERNMSLNPHFSSGFLDITRENPSEKRNLKAQQITGAEMSVLASQQPSNTNIDQVDSSVAPVKMLCSQQTTPLALEKSTITTLSPKPDFLHSRQSPLVSESPSGRILQTLRDTEAHTEISNASRQLISNSSETQVPSLEQTSKTRKNYLTDTQKLITPNEAILKPQFKASGFSVPQTPVLDEMPEQKRMKAEKRWVSLCKENKEIEEEIGKLKVMLESCEDEVRTPNCLKVVSNDSQEVINVYCDNYGDGTGEKRENEQEIPLCGQEDKTLKENDLRLLEATVMQELVSSADDSIVQSIKRELRNISEEVPNECSAQHSDCCILSENIIDVKEESKDLGLSELKKEEVPQGHEMVRSGITVAPSSIEGNLPVIKTISPSVGRARSTSLDSGYTTPSPHLQTDSVQHQDNFQVGCVGEREFICANCQQEASIYCSSCKGTLYCSTECQTTHWYMEHSSKCDGVPETQSVTVTQRLGPKV